MLRDTTVHCLTNVMHEKVAPFSKQCITCWLIGVVQEKCHRQSLQLSSPPSAMILHYENNICVMLVVKEGVMQPK